MQIIISTQPQNNYFTPSRVISKSPQRASARRDFVEPQLWAGLHHNVGLRPARNTSESIACQVITVGHSCSNTAPTESRPTATAEPVRRRPTRKGKKQPRRSLTGNYPTIGQRGSVHMGTRFKSVGPASSSRRWRCSRSAPSQPTHLPRQRTLHVPPIAPGGPGRFRSQCPPSIGQLVCARVVTPGLTPSRTGGTRHSESGVSRVSGSDEWRANGDPLCRANPDLLNGPVSMASRGTQSMNGTPRDSLAATVRVGTALGSYPTLPATTAEGLTQR